VYGLANITRLITWIAPENTSITIPVYDPAKDSFNRAAIRRFIRPTKKERKQMNLQNMRSLRIDAIIKLLSSM
jgi:hypothetical protein